MFCPLSHKELWVGLCLQLNKSVNGEIVREATDVFSVESNLPLSLIVLDSMFGKLHNLRNRVLILKGKKQAVAP